LETHSDQHLIGLITDPEVLYENAPCGYLSFTATGKILKVNKTLLNWLGYKKSDVEGHMSFSSLVSKGGRIYYEMFYFPLLQLQPHVNEINFDFIRKDGTKFPALINSTTFSGGDGMLLAVNAAVYDITERKRYETDLLAAKKAAEAERTRFEMLADFLPELIWTADDLGHINYANQRFTTFFQIPQHTFSLQQVLPKIHMDDRSRLIRKWMDAVKAGIDFQTEIRLSDIHGTYKWYMVRALPIKGGDGTVSKWMGSCTDINAHVMAIRHLDDFISIASHELKTPITGLKAALQLLDKFMGPSPGPKVELLIAQSNRSVVKIDNLVNDLLETGRLKEGQISLRKNRFNVSAFLQESCAQIRESGQYDLRIDCSPALTAFGDADRLDQVLTNLVNNAIKYAPGSTETVIRAEQDGDGVKISVADLGPGIPSDKLPYIFERFYRIDHAGRQYSGLGLGLYISSEIIRRHGGKIGVDSILAKGTTFWFSLPGK
jgi:PAS domain S-box-containing protein